jgi:hypothetical protein
MSGCNYIKKLIDEADKSDLLSFEVNEHIGRCGDCERFANERASLRTLLAAERRVSVPMNFDAMLKSRLVGVKARSAFSWLSAPGYMRLGAATASLVIMFFAAQYAGLFSDHSNRPIDSKTAVAAPPIAPPTLAAPPISVPAQVTTASTASRVRPYYPQNFRSGRGDVVARGQMAPVGFTAEDGGVVLVRGRNGEMDVPMPTVSVGAQPLLYVSAGHRPVRSAANSF